MNFYDMNGVEINVGDYVEPIEGRKLLIISRGKTDEYAEDVMIGQQVEDLFAFSLLTAENLAYQFVKVGESDSASREAEEILDIIMGGGES